MDVRHLSKISVLELTHRKVPAMLLISQVRAILTRLGFS